MSRARLVRPALIALAVALLACALASVAVGAVTVEPSAALAALGARVGVPLPWAFTPTQEAVLWTIRLPRTLLGAFVGAGLGVAGAALQGVFRNPLADPGLIGVSSGAALGAALLIVLLPAQPGAWLGALQPFALPAAACSGGAVAVVVAWRLASRGGHTPIATMILAGVAINALCGAFLGLLIYIADDVALRTLTLWTLGSLGGATWTVVAVVAPCVALGVAGLVGCGEALNAMLLGEREARHLGVAPRAMTRRVIALSALMVGAGVGFTGIIGFVGLVAPHLLRLALGPDHRHVLPGSALLGAALVLGADLICRTAVAPAELPIGVVMALLGAPFFLALMRRDLRREVP